MHGAWADHAQLLPYPAPRQFDIRVAIEAFNIKALGLALSHHHWDSTLQCIAAPALFVLDFQPRHVQWQNVLLANFGLAASFRPWAKFGRILTPLIGPMS